MEPFTHDTTDRPDRGHHQNYYWDGARVAYVRDRSAYRLSEFAQRLRASRVFGEGRFDHHGPTRCASFWYDHAKLWVDVREGDGMGMADPLFSPREQRILGAFLLHPDRSYSVSELIRIGGGHGAVQNVIDRLRAGDVIRDERVGNQRRYRVNPSFPLYPELRSICLKSFGLGERLKEALAPLASRIKEAFVFGSVARGTDRGDSDVDLFIVGDVSLFDVAPIAEAVSQEIGRQIHAQVYGPEEIASLSDDKVLRSILSGPRIEVIPNAAAT